MASPNEPRRFGAIAVQKGFITLEQLTRAMEIQLTEETMSDQHSLIGEILLEKGALSRVQYEEILKEMECRAG